LARVEIRIGVRGIRITGQGVSSATKFLYLLTKRRFLLKNLKDFGFGRASMESLILVSILKNFFLQK
jgi:hypothetical protein